MAILLFMVLAILTILALVPTEEDGSSVFGVSFYDTPGYSQGYSVWLTGPDSHVAQLLSAVNGSDSLIAEAAEGDAYAEFTEQMDFTAQVGEALQNPVLPAGCEAVSLTIVLRSMGFTLSLTEIADEHLPTNNAGDFVYGYSGSPYSFGGGFPPSLVTAANSYLASQGSVYQAHDITGSSFSELLEWTERGYPVIVWTTMYMGQPQMSGIFLYGYEWYNNEHCVVLYGTEGPRYLVSDPLEGLISRDAAEFTQIYETCGSMAMVIV